MTQKDKGPRMLIQESQFVSLRTRAHSLCVLVCVLLALVSIAPSASAATPAVLTEQGRLFDSGDLPVQGALSFVFTLYDTAAGDNVLWTETLPDVPVDDGYFSAQVGTVTPIPSNVFDGSIRYLGIAIGSDAEMSPRQAITSVAYALVAENATGDITPSSISINGSPVIDAKGHWVGASVGLAGPAGPGGPAGPAGPAGPEGATGETGSPGANGVPGAPGQSVVGQSEPAGSNCLTGGVKLTSASGVNYVCNGDTSGVVGPTGPVGPAGQSVVGQSEPPGANCAAGGAKLTSASGTTFVCNGVAGASGAVGPPGPTGAAGPIGAAGRCRRANRCHWFHRPCWRYRASGCHGSRWSIRGWSIRTQQR